MNFLRAHTSENVEINVYRKISNIPQRRVGGPDIGPGQSRSSAYDFIGNPAKNWKFLSFGIIPKQLCSDHPLSIGPRCQSAVMHQRRVFYILFIMEICNSPIFCK